MVFSLRQQGILRFIVAEFSPYRRKFGNNMVAITLLKGEKPVTIG
jgi:hypothetical protein